MLIINTDKIKSDRCILTSFAGQLSGSNGHSTKCQITISEFCS